MTSLSNERLYNAEAILAVISHLWTKSSLVNLFHIQQYIDLGNTVVLYHMDPYLPSGKYYIPQGYNYSYKENQCKVICQKSRH